METIYYTGIESPIGNLLIASSVHGLVRIVLPNKGIPDRISRLREDFPDAELVEDKAKNETAVQQLQEYFEGSRTTFSLPMDLRGTKFQKTVWQAVARVTYGQTRSYGEIAKEIDNPNASRAVGSANKTNPIPIVIPCHRIIGSDGSMTGYGGGIPLKEKLLRLEK